MKAAQVLAICFGILMHLAAISALIAAPTIAQEIAAILLLQTGVLSFVLAVLVAR
ncbi:MAG: hypothetical protein MN733_07855 [Nitrososphaera sp.]|nr:hypothetical protein [Nitrososphaera sp.]